MEENFLLPRVKAGLTHNPERLNHRASAWHGWRAGCLFNGVLNPQLKKNLMNKPTVLVVEDDLSGRK
jgi:hypothetical protein